MRARELYAIIASLSLKEREYVSAQVNASENGADLRQIFDYAAEHPDPSRKEISQGTKLSARRISELLPCLIHLVVKGLGHCEPDDRTTLELALNTAQKLMLRLENAAAVAILQSAFAQAQAQERYRLMLRAQEIAGMLSEPVTLAGPGATEITAHLRTINELQSLKAVIDQAKVASTEQRHRIVRETSNSSIMRGGVPQDSLSAKALYLAIRTRMLVYSGQYSSATENQGLLVDLLTEHPWLCALPEYHLLKEINPYVGLLMATEDHVRAEQLIFRVGNFQTEFPRIELLKWNQLYPLRLTSALADGDLGKGDYAMEEMLRLYREKKKLFSEQNINRGLYYIAYYLIAKGDVDGARRTVARMLRNGGSAAFMPFYLPMAKILSAVIDFESGEWDDLSMKIKNFRQTKAFRESPFYRLILNLLSKLTYLKSDLQRYETLKVAYDEAMAMQENSAHAAYFTFFDLPRWVQSKQKQVSMIEIFRSSTDIEPGAVRSVANGD